jgi:cytochrome c
MDEGSELDRRIAAFPGKLRATIQSCRQCHSLRNGAGNGSKIGLAGIYGRDIGAGRADLYSKTLKLRPGMWDDKNLDAFLASPERWAPGTTMEFTGIEDDHIRSSLIGFLRTLN